MTLPRGVKEQAEKANAIQAQLAGKPPEGASPPVQNLPPEEGSEDWEKRYKGLQRTHQKTAEEVTELRDQNEKLTQEVADIKALLEKANEAEPAAQGPVFTDAEVKEYGQDFLDMVVRVAGSMNAGKSQDDIAQELQELKGTLNTIVTTQHQTAEERFYADLERMVPDWEQINESEEFKAWLKEKMPLTSSERQRFLETAHKRLDVDTVASFFTTFKSESGASYMPDTHTANSGMPEVEGGKETFIVTQAEIANFYEEVRRGKWKGREDEMRQNELKINRAIKDGRVR